MKTSGSRDVTVEMDDGRQLIVGSLYRHGDPDVITIGWSSPGVIERQLATGVSDSDKKIAIDAANAHWDRNAAEAEKYEESTRRSEWIGDMTDSRCN